MRTENILLKLHFAVMRIMRLYLRIIKVSIYGVTGGLWLEPAIIWDGIVMKGTQPKYK